MFTDGIISSMLVTSSLRFKGTCDSLKSYADSYNPSAGDVVMCDGYVYCYTGESFEKLSSADDTSSNDHETNIEPVEIKCNNCCAPIHITSKYQSVIKCEYCGSIYKCQ